MIDFRMKKKLYMLILFRVIVYKMCIFRIIFKDYVYLGEKKNYIYNFFFVLKFIICNEKVLISYLSKIIFYNYRFEVFI